MSDRISIDTTQRSKTLVEQTADALVRAAAEGRIQLGERLLEAELASDLAISRVPVREALRMLESQGIVVNTPYRGIHMFEADDKSLSQLLTVRQLLEEHAIVIAMKAIAKDPAKLVPFEDALFAMKNAMRRKSCYELALSDIEFHKAIYMATDNPVLVDMWSMMSRKLLILIGLGLYENEAMEVYESHEALFKLIEKGNVKDVLAALKPHINEARNSDRYAGKSTPRKRVA